jgi:hypothetical protein
MRLFADENIATTVIQDLRQRGDDVLSVKESMRSEQDDAILGRAQAENRVVINTTKFSVNWPSDQNCQPRVASSCFVWQDAILKRTTNEFSTHLLAGLIGLDIFQLSQRTRSECDRCL